MTIIASIDAINRDIYLHADTVGGAVHPIDVYKEMRALRRTDESLRKYTVFLKAYGNVAKGAGKYTERYVQCINGTKIIPYDVSHQLTITGTIITDDGQEGVACFDRTPLTITTLVDINYVPPQVEIITVPTGGINLVEQDKLDIADRVWGAITAPYTTKGTFGHHVKSRLITFAKWFAFK